MVEEEGAKAGKAGAKLEAELPFPKQLWKGPKQTQTHPLLRAELADLARRARRARQARRIDLQVG